MSEHAWLEVKPEATASLEKIVGEYIYPGAYGLRLIQRQ